MTDNERAFGALVLKGMELNQPRHYTDDLHHHDRVTLGLYRIPENRYYWTVKEGAPFAWIVRDCGTELIGTGEDGKIWNLEILGYYLKGGFGRDNVSCWWWDGAELTRIELREAHDRLSLASYHADRIKGHSVAVV